MWDDLSAYIVHEDNQNTTTIDTETSGIYEKYFPKGWLQQHLSLDLAVNEKGESYFILADGTKLNIATLKPIKEELKVEKILLDDISIVI